MTLAGALRTIGAHGMPSGAGYGPLHPAFQWDLARGYTVLTGANNAGKSALLQLVFLRLIDDAEFGVEKVALISSDRQYLAGSNETGGQSLASFNSNYRSLIADGVLSNESERNPNSTLGRLLMAHDDMVPQIQRTNEMLEQLGLPQMQVRGPGQAIQFDDVVSYFQGSGLRALFPILAALSDTRLSAILIDEPELSLEPTLQRTLREMLVRWAVGDRSVVLATHSHLFLDRVTVLANQVVSQTGGVVEVRPVADEVELMDVVFKLLGNSTEDLFFPYNYLVVEGASDQAMVERIAELQGVPPGRIKVLAASGITEVGNVVFAVERALLPVVVDDSPYADRVVAVIDQPGPDHEAHVVEIRRVLGDRLVELDAPNLESYVPEEIYAAARIDKPDALRRIASAGTLAEARRLKREISTALAAATTPQLAELMPLLNHAVELANR